MLRRGLVPSTADGSPWRGDKWDAVEEDECEEEEDGVCEEEEDGCKEEAKEETDEDDDVEQVEKEDADNDDESPDDEEQHNAMGRCDEIYERNDVPRSHIHIETHPPTCTSYYHVATYSSCCVTFINAYINCEKRT